MTATILIVDDDPDIVTLLHDRLESFGHSTITAQHGQEALRLLAEQSPDLILLDLEMPTFSGLEFLQTLATNPPTPKKPTSKEPSNQPQTAPPVIVMTAHGTIASAVEAMKCGAVDFLTKPFDMDYLALVIEKALERVFLKDQVAYLRSELNQRYASIVGRSPQLTPILEAAQRAAQSDVGVLLLGESGTGKELFARSLHRWSPRQAMPFVVINCVALTETLLENELFGHEKGAFTGADRLEKGKIEAADGGTLFLDEIGDMPLGLQAKLLRVLQDREFQRVGGNKMVKVNIRVIAATNKNLPQAVKTGQFREDLYYRLNIITLTLPPLRERPEDIPLLADYFLARHATDAKRPHMSLTPAAVKALSEYSWPGNIRELDNAIARAVVMSPQDAIPPQTLGLSHGSTHESGDDANGDLLDLPYHNSMEEHSKRIIRHALKLAHGNQTKAAERLQLQRTYLARLIRQKNIPLA